MAMRRTISRALIPASTKTRVPLATSNTALPVEPLPSTEIFIDQIQERADTNKLFIIYHWPLATSCSQYHPRQRMGPAPDEDIRNTGGTDLIATSRRLLQN